MFAATVAFALPFSALADENDTNKEGKFKKFTECAAVRMREINIKHVAKGEAKHFTQVPEGWTVISGTGGEGHPKLLICR